MGLRNNERKEKFEESYKTKTRWVHRTLVKAPEFVDICARDKKLQEMAEIAVPSTDY